MSKQDVKNKILRQSANGQSDNKNTIKQPYFGVLFGKIDDGRETVLLKKVFTNYDDSIEYTQDFVKRYITDKCGPEFFNNHSGDCVSYQDVIDEKRADGYYLIKSNNVWSVYNVSTEIKAGYIANYATKDVRHVFNIYIAKEGGTLTTLTKDYCEHDQLVEEIKMKLNSK